VQQALGKVELRDLFEAFSRRPDVSHYQLSGLIARFFETSRFRNLELDVLRLDKIHPFISGNKWFKLKHHLLAAYASEHNHVLSFGGAYSNHLHALAYAGHHYGFSTTGIIRGEKPSRSKLSPTLIECESWGMCLRWMNRQDYRRYATAEHKSLVQSSYPDTYIIPEGGEGLAGLQGIRELMEHFFDELDEGYDIILTPVGSGTTQAGIIAAAPQRQRVIGVSALKGASDLEQRVSQYLPRFDTQDIEIWHDYHHGGFAKMTPLLRRFISEFHQNYGLLLDPIYTGKALYALAHKFAHHKLGDNVRALMVHTGGLQGWRGFSDGIVSES
jgi:1-aminocyclopropane-1-carboxylate deaminase/D-cysteine desulfhydrase-like pyridoxal-dependent ACC family enzyme